MNRFQRMLGIGGFVISTIGCESQLEKYMGGKEYSAYEHLQQIEQKLYDAKHELVFSRAHFLVSPDYVPDPQRAGWIVSEALGSAVDYGIIDNGLISELIALRVGLTKDDANLIGAVREIDRITEKLRILEKPYARKLNSL